MVQSINLLENFAKITCVWQLPFLWLLFSPSTLEGTPCSLWGASDALLSQPWGHAWQNMSFGMWTLLHGPFCFCAFLTHTLCCYDWSRLSQQAGQEWINTSGGGITVITSTDCPVPWMWFCTSSDRASPWPALTLAMNQMSESLITKFVFSKGAKGAAPQEAGCWAVVIQKELKIPQMSCEDWLAVKGKKIAAKMHHIRHSLAPESNFILPFI